jgi:hypothetical protein
MIATARTPAFGVLFLSLLVQSAAGAPAEPVAVVYEIQGKAMWTAPGCSPQPLRLYDHLPARTTLEIAPASRLALAFATGRRHEISGPARATLGKGDLTERSGGVRPLPSVPPLPRLAAITEDDRPGRKAGAIRIRGERIPGLYPHRGATVLPGRILLRFPPVAGAEKYRIEVHDDHGRMLFATDSPSSPVEVPAGTLRAGLRYPWTVRTLNRPGAVARGEAELILLGENAARMRQEAHEILKLEGPDSMLLMAEIDRSLGLLLEAEEDLQAASRGMPGDPALLAALARIATQRERKNDLD